MPVDPVSLIIALPGLMQTCVHEYRFECEMMELDKNMKVLRLRYRIEGSRLVLWGRFWDLLANESGVEE